MDNLLYIHHNRQCVGTDRERADGGHPRCHHQDQKEKNENGPNSCEFASLNSGSIIISIPFTHDIGAIHIHPRYYPGVSHLWRHTNLNYQSESKYH